MKIRSNSELDPSKPETKDAPSGTVSSPARSRPDNNGALCASGAASWRVWEVRALRTDTSKRGAWRVTSRCFYHLSGLNRVNICLSMEMTPNDPLIDLCVFDALKNSFFLCRRMDTLSSVLEQQQIPCCAFRSIARCNRQVSKDIAARAVSLSLCIMLHHVTIY